MCAEPQTAAQVMGAEQSITHANGAAATAIQPARGPRHKDATDHWI